MSETFWSGIRQIVRLSAVVGLHFFLQTKTLDPLKVYLRDWELVLGEAIGWLAAIVIVVVGENKVFARPSIAIQWKEHQRSIDSGSLQIPSSGDGSQRTIDVELAYARSSSLLGALVNRFVTATSGTVLRITLTPVGILRLTKQFSPPGVRVERSQCEIDLVSPQGTSGPISSFTLMIQASKAAAQGEVAVIHEVVAKNTALRVILPRMLRRDATLKTFYVARRN